MTTKTSTLPTAQSHAVPSTTLTIAGVSEPVILRYFEMLNEGAFQAVGELFAADGEMQPPFEQAVVGVEAIAAYLQAEAKGFTLLPQQGVVKQLDSGCTEVQVAGKVKTAVFSVNVSWFFVLNSERKLLLAKIKLLASPQELLSLRG